MSPVYIKQSFGKILLILSLAILANYICIMVIISDGINYKWGGFFTKYVLTSIALFFVTILILWLVYRIIFPQPLLTVTSEGFIDNSTVLFKVFVPWNIVEKIYIEQGKTNYKRSIYVDINNKKEFTNSLSFLNKKIVQISLYFGNPPIDIVLSLSKYKPEEVVEIMQKYKAEYDRIHQMENESKSPKKITNEKI